MENIDVKVFKNLCDDIIEFETIDEFNNYYKINKAEIDKLSTRGINQKYKVKNHRIGREKGAITLFPLKQSSNIQHTPQPASDVVDENGISTHEKLNRLNSRLKNIENILNQLLEAIFENQNDTRQQSIPMHSQQSSRFATYGM